MKSEYNISLRITLIHRGACYTIVWKCTSCIVLTNLRPVSFFDIFFLYLFLQYTQCALCKTYSHRVYSRSRELVCSWKRFANHLAKAKTKTNKLFGQSVTRVSWLKNREKWIVVYLKLVHWTAACGPQIATYVCNESERRFVKFLNY